MARKKKQEDEEEVTGDPLDQLRASVEKKWGKGIMVSASSILDEPQVVIPLGPNLDMALFGGIPEGSWAWISGPPKVGKTTTLLSFAAQAQRPEYGSRTIYYFNIEKRLKRKNLNGIRGLDLDPRRFVIYESKKDRILSGQDHLEIAIEVLQTVPNAVVILDSVSALVHSAVLEGGLGTQTRGGGAKLVSEFIDIVASVVPVQKSIVLGVTHIIADTSGRSAGGKVEKAANRWLYQADVRLKATYAKPWVVGATKNAEGESVGGREIGKEVYWTCQESALGPPGIKCQSFIRYGIGVDRSYEVLEMGKAADLFTMKGHWYGFSFLADHPELLGGKEVPNANGVEKAYALLNENPAWADLLNVKVGEFLRGDEQ